MSKDLFPQRSTATPTIYAYQLPNDSSRTGQLKIGDTNKTAKERIKEQIGATRSAFNIVWEESAMRKLHLAMVLVLTLKRCAKAICCH
jgi:hypothetical protein